MKDIDGMMSCILLMTTKISQSNMASVAPRLRLIVAPVPLYRACTKSCLTL